jgi:nitrogen fixation/metabolism regulation signal transduction histidine kinase
VRRIRTRLIVAFLAATMLPLAATIWITTTLIDRSLAYATTGELARLSRTLEATVRQFYQHERESLKREAVAGRVTPSQYRLADISGWPAAIRAFWESGEHERFAISGESGDRIDYMRRRDESAGAPAGVDAYARDLGGVRMEQLSTEVRNARQLVDSLEERDLRRGFTLALLLLLGAAWIVSLAPLVFIAHRISQPIQQLTAALTDFAAGDWERRLDAVPAARSQKARVKGTVPFTQPDEVGSAIEAFNHMADQLRQNRDRLVHLTQIASWQSLARKTAHELKNSLTPIRLTVEEIQARQPTGDRAFIDQAVQIVVSEIDSLERRVRAFSEFSSEPPVHPEMLDINALVEERVSLLRPAHTDTDYRLDLDQRRPRARAGADLVKGILTNLLQNAAEAAGHGGSVLVITNSSRHDVAIEIHDSGPGISAEATATLFEPTITFKKHGMGLGLSIAKKNAMLSGGDVTLIPGKLAGAAFKVTLPLA